MNQNDELLIAELRRDEGVRYSPYKDSKGIWTVGVGHNMEASALPATWACPLSDAQVDQLLSDDIMHVLSGLDRYFGWWRNMSYARQRAIVNFVFNVGIGTALQFTTSMKHIERGEYAAAADSMLANRWARQVGDRSKRVTELIRNG